MMYCRPPQPTSSSEVAVRSVYINPQNHDQIIVCTHSSTIYVMTLHGQVVKTFTSKKESSMEVPTDFVAITPSPKGEYLYGFAENGRVYCFNTETKALEHSYVASEKGPIGLVHHSFRNLLATYATDGALKTWVP